ncbi:MAG TPA: hypothetical protein PKV44_02660 [Bacillota bacterium]|nr:hypothetical protein [Bacillota bacterium]HPE38329.1 hypothetical protein [Bacillota bacterium]
MSRAVGVKFIGLCLIVSLLFSCASCAKTTKENDDIGNYEDYLGEYYYDTSIGAMVFETPEGEEEPGVMIREVTDLDALIKTCPIPICLFFYSSMRTDQDGMIAVMEQLTEEYHASLFVVMIDALSEAEITEAYGIEALPDAIIIKNDRVTAHFDGLSQGTWAPIDLATWAYEESR